MRTPMMMKYTAKNLMDASVKAKAAI